jgi:hypothetical protein
MIMNEKLTINHQSRFEGGELESETIMNKEQVSKY